MCRVPPVTVHLLRHGEVHNPEDLLYGRLPGFRLSELGQRQARAAAQWLAGRDLGYLVASPLQRAQETAAPIAEATGLTVATDERLVEAGNELEGRRVDGAASLFADPKLWWNYRNPLRPSWGEPYQQIAARMLAAARAARDAAEPREAVASATSCRWCAPRAAPGASSWRTIRGPGGAASPRSPRWSSTATSSSGSATTNRPHRCRPAGAQVPNSR